MVKMRVLHILPTYPMLLLSLLVASLSGDSLEQATPHSEDLPSICHHSCESSMNDTMTADFCESHSDLTIVGRCCLNVTASNALVLGIDLQRCGLSEGKFSSAIANMSHLLYISLEGNDMKSLLNTDFHRNTDIKYLSLPPDLSCPGINGTWLKESSEANSTVCQFEQNACDVHNVTCPSNSHCVHSGVDMTECLCDDGFHGYKCLQQGTFPVTSFLVGITIPTVVLCIFFYITQRRHVLSQSRKLR